MNLTSRRTASAAFAVATFATSAGAQERTLFTWTSTIDREVVLVMKGRNVESRGAGLDASFRPRLELRDALPRDNGYVSVHLAGGRGHAEVLEHPSARNDYTTTIRVSDARSGADNYSVVASWRPAGDARRGGDWDRDRRNDDWDRGRRDNDCRPFPGNSNNRGRGDDRWEERNRRDCGDWDRNRRNAGVLRWSGLVDDVSEIRISGRRVEYRTRSGAPVRGADFDFVGSGMPHDDVRVVLTSARGRGSFQIVQQPSRRNNYTAIVRIVDKRSGYGAYDFSLRW